jgi:hypothetical protein
VRQAYWRQEKQRVPYTGEAIDEAIDAVSSDASILHDLVRGSLVHGFQSSKRITLNLDRATVLPLPSDSTSITLENLNINALILRSQC